jgi:hypothetical protein
MELNYPTDIQKSNCLLQSYPSFFGWLPLLNFIVLFCSFTFLFLPWYLLEKPEMDVAQIQFNYSIFLLNALSAFALNIPIFLVIGRTGAVIVRVAGVLKDWILIALSTIIFPESIITSLNIIGYAIGNYVSFFPFYIMFRFL